MTTESFEMVLPEDLWGLSFLFRSEGHQLYVVGGAVRDAVMGLKPKDYDVATDATPDQVIALLAQVPAWRLTEVGKAFGVVRVRLEGGDHEYEVATFRRDVGEGRRPDSVVFTSIDEDVLRRDLTVNALFYDPQRGCIVDLVGGLADIRDQVIRTVGEPDDRFREDRLRVLRAIRFASRFGWSMDAATAMSICNDNNLSGVSPERIRDEFVKGLAGSRSVRQFLAELERFDMWPRIFPGLHVSRSPDVMVSSSGPESRSVPVVLALLLEGNHPDVVGKSLSGLKYTSDEVRLACFLRDFRDMSPACAYRFRRRFDALNIDDELLVEYCLERGLPPTAMVTTFLDYQVTEAGETLLAEGFSGAALGRELERRETLHFQQLLDG